METCSVIYRKISLQCNLNENLVLGLFELKSFCRKKFQSLYSFIREQDEIELGFRGGIHQAQISLFSHLVVFFKKKLVIEDYDSLSLSACSCMIVR